MQALEKGRGKAAGWMNGNGGQWPVGNLPDEQSPVEPFEPSEPSIRLGRTLFPGIHTSRRYII